MRVCDVKRRFERKNKEVFDRVLKEAGKGCMIPTHTFLKVLFRPNNYRRVIDVRRSKNLLEELKGHTFSFRVESSNGHVYVKDFMGVGLMLGKRTLTAIYSQRVRNGVKETFLVSGRSLGEVERGLEERKAFITGLLDKALFSFARRFKLVSGVVVPRWSRYEDWIKGEDYIDRLPESMIIQDSVFKKVYGSGVEFTRVGGEEPVAHVKQYIKNRALEDASGLAHEQLMAIREGFDRVMELLERQAEVNGNTVEALGVVADYLKSRVGKPKVVACGEGVGKPSYVG